MAQNDVLKRYLDAGIAFTKMTQEREEAIVRELVGAGEVGAEQATSTVTELVDRSRENTERLLDTVRAEINAQIGNLGLASREDVDALRKEVAALRGDAPADKAQAKEAPAKKQAEKAAPKDEPAAGKGSDEEPAAGVPDRSLPGKKAQGAAKAAKKSAPTKKA